MLETTHWIYRSRKVKEQHVARATTALAGVMRSGERPMVIVRGLGISPGFDLIVVTDQRLFLLEGDTRVGELLWTSFEAVEVKNYMVRHTISLTMPGATKVVLPLQDECDVQPLRDALVPILHAAGTGPAAAAKRSRWEESQRVLMQDPHAALVPDCTVLGGHGLALEPGTRCDLRIGNRKLYVTHPDHTVLLELDWDGVLALEFSGNGTMKSGGGFMGGGFGIEGFAIGLIAATALNAVTSRTYMDSALSVRTADGELVVHSGTYAPDTLRIGLSALVAHVDRPRASTSTGDAHEVDTATIEQLSNIRVLREQGVLTDEEYESARARLARRLAG